MAADRVLACLQGKIFVIIVQMYYLLLAEAQSENLALNKPVNMSSTFYYNYDWEGRFAVDNRTGWPDGCRCCSGTNSAGNPHWLTLDLGDIYTLGNIVVQGRTDLADPEGGGSLSQLSVYIKNDTSIDGTLVFTNPAGQIVQVPLPGSQSARYVSLVLRREEFLIICELQVYKKDCPAGLEGPVCQTECDDGWYGVNCASRCGNCRDVTGCDKMNGECTTGCIDGYQGDTCTEDCTDGWYGPACSLRCGSCTEPSQCNHVNGTCGAGCIAGYQGILCDRECDVGDYGANCQSQCGNCADVKQCNKINGTCMTGGCLAGYQGSQCTEECMDGWYGSGCSSSCGKCADVSQCNHINGTCMTGCSAGYQGLLCNDECEDGRYGVNCQSQCGNCADVTHCNKVNGTCMTGGCSAGFQGSQCTEACTGQTFGVNCSSRCHCADGVPCNGTNGYCPNEQCEIGWGGKDCARDLNLVQRLRDNITVTMSTPYTDTANSQVWVAERAVDGDEGPDPEVCQCCSGTFVADPWWRLDLREQYLIDVIVVYMRSEGYVQYEGFQVFVSNTSDLTTEEIYTNNRPDTKFVINATLPRPLQFLEIRRPVGVGLTICEVQLLEKVCESGSFGYGCQHPCYCDDMLPCHPITGQCQSEKCLMGWKGPSCNQECERGEFGHSCEEQCRCTSPDQCSRFDGDCGEGACLPGYQGFNCQTECRAGMFGQNCSGSCGQCAGQGCSHLDGNCTDGCVHGWTGDLCQIQLSGPPEPPNPETGAIVGGVAAGVVVIAVLAIVLVVLRRKRANKDARQTPRPQARHTVPFDDNDSKQLRAVPDKVEESVPIQLETNSVDVNDVVIYDNLAFVKRGGVPVDELFDFINTWLRDGKKEFISQFSQLKTGLVHSHEEGSRPENKKKNRYRGMIAYDHSRVCLKTMNSAGTDYINACYINGYEKVNKFIASQGPTEHMIDDFWQMVWQEGCGKIVMLTNVIEMGAVKCVLYWPEEGDMVFGSITVKLLWAKSSPDFTIRSLEITKGSEAARHVTQFHYQAWPDKDVPDGAWSLVNFWREVSRHQGEGDGPCIVHCSAGVGRTGTFIGLDCLANQAKAEGVVQVFECVETLRRQRVNMVQTKDQFIYLHEALAESLNVGTHLVLTGQFSQWYEGMQKCIDGGNKTGLDIQYERYLASFGVGTNGDDRSKMWEAIQKQQGEKRSCPFGESTNVVKNFAKKDVFILVPSPAAEALDALWQLVGKHNIRTVIMLTDKRSAHYQACQTLGTKTKQDSKNYFCKCVESSTEDVFAEKTFSYRRKDQIADDARTVKQFEFQRWSADNVPESASSVFRFLDRVMQWQPYQSELEPILIHSSPGSGRGGLVAILLGELCRIKMDGGTNVLQAAKALSVSGKVSDVPSFLQYKFCLEALLEHIAQAEVYENLPI